MTTNAAREDLLNMLKDKLKAYPELLERNYAKNRSDDDPTRIRVMQWNMLARSLCIHHKNCTDEATIAEDAYDWEKVRLWRTLQELVRFDSDIICVEEVDCYEEIKPYMHSLGYSSVYCPKMDSPCLVYDNNVGPDGTAIFFRLSQFRVATTSFEKIMLADEVQSQIFVILQLTHVASGKLITVVATHLKSKTTYADRRRDQVKYIMSIVKAHINAFPPKTSSNHLIFCGDFNGEPFEDFYKLIVNDQDLTVFIWPPKSDFESEYYTMHRVYAKEHNKPQAEARNVSKSKLERRDRLRFWLNFLNDKLAKYPAIMSRDFLTTNKPVLNAYSLKSQFRVMQWNGLAKALCDRQHQPYSPKEVFEWDTFRKWRCVEEIIRHDCDIICLQEADFYEDIRPYLHDLGFQSIFFPKNSHRSQKEEDQDGCLVFYQKESFQLIKTRGENICVNGVDHGQVFIIIQLRHKLTKKKLTVVCVHLKAYGEYVEMRQQQTDFILKVLRDQLLTDIDLCTNDLSEHPIVICGDFNGASEEAFYNSLMRNKDIDLTNAYAYVPKSTTRRQRIIDYVFYTKSTLRLLSYIDSAPPKQEPGTKREPNYNYIPNLRYPSDHLSLVCDFQFEHFKSKE